MEEFNLDLLQFLVAEWHSKNFPMVDLNVDQLGLTEEVGELSRALVKMHTGYRGSPEEWKQEAYKEIGDVFISLLNVASALQINLSDAVMDRWETISKRDWTVDRVQHGIEKA